MLTDTHCHLDLPAFDPDRDAVLDRARQAGVGRILNPGLDLESSRRAVALADRYREVYAAVGFHPHDSGKLGSAELQELRHLAQHPKVKAIGEIGLDYYRRAAPPAVQRRAFRQQLALAAELDLPVVIHNREAHADLLAILAAWRQERAGAGRIGVLHSFSGGDEQVGPAAALGLDVGFTGPITFPKADDVRRAAAAAPLDRLLIETDAPYLAPAPYRGQRNEPAYVRRVAERLAEVREETTESIVRQTGLNAASLFDWSARD